MRTRLIVFVMVCSATAVRGQAPIDIGRAALVTTSIRTNDTEVFIIDPATGDAFNLTKAPAS